MTGGSTGGSTDCASRNKPSLKIVSLPKKPIPSYIHTFALNFLTRSETVFTPELFFGRVTHRGFACPDRGRAHVLGAGRGEKFYRAVIENDPSKSFFSQPEPCCGEPGVKINRAARST